MIYFPYPLEINCRGIFEGLQAEVMLIIADIRLGSFLTLEMASNSSNTEQTEAMSGIVF